MKLKTVKKILLSMSALTALGCGLLVIQADMASALATCLIIFASLFFFIIWLLFSKCPSCHMHLSVRGGGIFANYCPNCGASLCDENKS